MSGEAARSVPAARIKARGESCPRCKPSVVTGVSPRSKNGVSLVRLTTWWATPLEPCAIRSASSRTAPPCPRAVMMWSTRTGRDPGSLPRGDVKQRLSAARSSMPYTQVCGYRRAPVVGQQAAPSATAAPVSSGGPPSRPAWQRWAMGSGRLAHHPTVAVAKAANRDARSRSVKASCPWRVSRTPDR